MCVKYLSFQVGDPKDTVRNGVKALFKQICVVYSVTKLFGYLMEGLKSKNARQRTGKCNSIYLNTIKVNLITVISYFYRHTYKSFSNKKKNYHKNKINRLTGVLHARRGYCIYSLSWNYCFVTYISAVVSYFTFKLCHRIYTLYSWARLLFIRV